MNDWMKARALLWAAYLVACGAPEPAKDTDGAGRTLPAPTPPVPANASASTGTPHASDTASGAQRVLIIGTSLTAGLGLDPDESYPALLQRKVDSTGLAIRIENAGLSGETSAGALRRADWLLREPAAVVMIETGANDGLRGLDVDSTRENLRAIVRAVRRASPDARILLAQMEAPPNLGADYTTRFREMFPAVAREEGAVLVPFLLDGVAGIAEMNQGDGIHPNRDGARRVADNVWRTLAPELERLGRAR
jgi:acyl-CoA thioesterase-1